MKEMKKIFLEGESPTLEVLCKKVGPSLKVLYRQNEKICVFLKMFDYSECGRSESLFQYIA